MKKICLIIGLVLLSSLPSKALDCRPGHGCTVVIATADTACSLTACLHDPLPVNTQIAAVQIAGTFTGTLQFERSADNGANWASAAALGSGDTSATAAGIWTFNVAGMTNFRVRASALAVAGPTVTIQLSKSSVSGVQLGGTNLAAPLPINFVDTATVGWTNTSLGNIEATALSLKWNALTAPDGNLAINLGARTTTFTGTGLFTFGAKVKVGSTTFAGLTADAAGTIVYCTNCDTPASQGATCSASGDTAGAEAHRIRGAWQCY